MIDTSDEAIAADLRTAEQAQSDRMMNLAMQKARLRVALRSMPQPVQTTFEGNLPPTGGGPDPLDVQVVQREEDDVYVVPHGAVVEDRVEVANRVVAGAPGYGVWVLSDDAPPDVRWGIAYQLLRMSEGTILYDIESDAPWAKRLDAAARILGVDYDAVEALVGPLAPAAIDDAVIEDAEPTIVVPAAAPAPAPAGEDPAEHSEYADDEDADIWEQARQERGA